MAAATAAYDEVLQISLPPQRFEGAVDFAESILHMIRAIFAQLDHALNEYSMPVMQFNGLGDEIFKYVFIEDEGHRSVSVKVGWNDCGIPEPSTSFEWSLPTGQLMLSFKKIRPWGGQGMANTRAAKINRFLRLCAACAANETAAGKRLCCCKRCKDGGIMV